MNKSTKSKQIFNFLPRQRETWDVKHVWSVRLISIRRKEKQVKKTVSEFCRTLGKSFKGHSKAFQNEKSNYDVLKFSQFVFVFKLLRWRALVCHRCSQKFLAKTTTA